jgi:hypothetical protein
MLCPINISLTSLPFLIDIRLHPDNWYLPSHRPYKRLHLGHSLSSDIRHFLTTTNPKAPINFLTNRWLQFSVKEIFKSADMWHTITVSGAITRTLSFLPSHQSLEGSINQWLELHFDFSFTLSSPCILFSILTSLTSILSSAHSSHSLNLITTFSNLTSSLHYRLLSHPSFLVYIDTQNLSFTLAKMPMQWTLANERLVCFAIRISISKVQQLTITSSFCASLNYLTLPSTTRRSPKHGVSFHIHHDIYEPCY